MTYTEQEKLERKANRQKEKGYEFIKDADSLHPGLYDYSNVIYIKMHSKVDIICLIHGSFWQTPHNHLKDQHCPDCALINSSRMAIKITNEMVDNDLMKNNPTIKHLGNYIGKNHKTECLCTECNYRWPAYVYQVKNGMSGCPKCNDTKLSNEYIDNCIKEQKLLIERVDDYVGALKIMSWNCLQCHNMWMAQTSNVIKKDGNGSGCPNCARYKNEKLVGIVLKELNIMIKNLVIKFQNKRLLPDYYLPELNIIIEYNGKQHYEPVEFFNQSEISAEQNFEKQKIRDENMRIYCKNNDIFLLEIDGREYTGLALRQFVSDFFGKDNILRFKKDNSDEK